MVINEKQKPWAITREELNLRFDYAESKITLEEFKMEYKKLLKQGLIVRSGKVVRE